MRPIPAAHTNTDTHPVQDIAEGLRYSWGNTSIRSRFIAIASANFLVMGPIFVGLPVIAQSRLVGGAAAFGMIMAASGIGSLVGMIAAGTLPRPSDRLFSWLAVALFAGFAVGVGALGFITNPWIAAALMLATGLGNGYIAVVAMTALQRMAPKEMLGRVMSLIMLAMVGLAPISQAISGAVIRISPEVLFGGAGVGFLIVAIWAATQRDAWNLGGDEPAEELSAEAVAAVA
jgi:MFS family permease